MSEVDSDLQREEILRVPCPTEDCRVKQGVDCRWIEDLPYHPERVELAELYWKLNERTKEVGGNDER